MATKSILKDINIRDKRLARSFIVALEQAESKPDICVDLSKSVNVIKKDQIKKLFGKDNAERL